METRKLMPIAEVQHQLGGLGRTTVWKLVKANSLEQVNIGRRSFITGASVDAYVESLRSE